MGRLSERTRLHEPELQDTPVSLRKGGQDVAYALWSIGLVRRVLQVRAVGLDVDRRHLEAEPAPPVRGQDRPGRGQEVGADLTLRRRHAQGNERGLEHL